MKTRVSQVGRRTAEKTLTVGGLVHLHQRVEERDIVTRTRIERTFSLGDLGQLPYSILLWLAEVPLPLFSACWDWWCRVVQR